MLSFKSNYVRYLTLVITSLVGPVHELYSVMFPWKLRQDPSRRESDSGTGPGRKGYLTSGILRVGVVNPDFPLFISAWCRGRCRARGTFSALQGSN